jgi:hypothetical protein
MAFRAISMPIPGTPNPSAGNPQAELAELCRARLVEAAIDAWEQAGLSGLCHEGRWECVLAALRRTPLPPARNPE